MMPLTARGKMMANKRVLVVGGAGFIGSMVNKMLIRAGYEVVVLDNLSKGRRKAVLLDIPFIQADLADCSAINDVFASEAFDAVMHFAAFTDVGESVNEPSLYYQNNVVNTINLLEAMRRHQVRTLIFSSSAAVYGLPLTEPLTESHPCQPINPYGESKRMVELILRDYDQAYGIRSCCLRYFNAAGGDPEGEIGNYKTKENNLIPVAIDCLLHNRPVTIFGTDYPTPDGSCIRDYIHVYDLGSAHIAAMERLWEGSPSSTYNLGNGRGFSVKEVLASLKKVTGQSLVIHEGARRPGDPAILIADATRAQKELGWRPQFADLETIISHACHAKQLEIGRLTR